jgi:hemoglobin-like flavoprotein
MSSESDVQLVQRSFEMILPMADTFAAMFYDRFFTVEPEVRPLFKSEMAVQREKVIEMLALAVHNLDNPELMQRELHDLGSRHVGYRVETRHYAIMNEAILGALADCLGDQFTSEMQSAWENALDLLAKTMTAAHP